MRSQQNDVCSNNTGRVSVDASAVLTSTPVLFVIVTPVVTRLPTAAWVVHVVVADGNSVDQRANETHPETAKVPE